MVQGLLLAGGKSERLGRNKILLPFGKDTVLGHNLVKLLELVDQVIVVTGRYHESISAYIEENFLDQPVEVVYNEAYERGMFSSVQKGLSRVHEDVVIVPGDCAFYDVKTLQVLMDKAGLLIVPSFDHKAGHPMIIRKPLVALLKEEKGDSNLKAFRNKHTITWVDVEDPGILRDLDTVEDYQRYLNEP